MAPIKVGILGLSTKASAWATVAHWPYLKTSDYYQVVAVCNSSLESSKAAIKHHNLPDSTRAYASYGDLAQDEEIDLYVVSTRADTHYEVAMPALEAGKNVYVEWPLGANKSQAGKMADMARRKNVKTIVGLQGRASPSVNKVKEIVESGRLGEVHSVDYQGAAHVWQDNAASNRYHYFLDRTVGGNLLTIYGGHVLDSIMFALGELKPESVSVLAGNLRKKMKLKMDDGSLSSTEHDKDTPDQIMLQGRLDRHPPALLSFHLRAGDRFIDQPGSVWKIYGTKAELQMVFATASPQIGAPASIRIADFETGQVEDVEVDEGGTRWTDLPAPGQNIGRLYEAYATGGEFADWDIAVKRHELVDSFYDQME